MKEVKLPFTVRSQDVVHHKYRYNLDGTQEHTHYLLNPAERVWYRIVDWIKEKIGK